MKTTRVIAAASVAGLLGAGAAAATLPADGPTAATAAGTPSPKPIVRTLVVRETVHRTRHAQPSQRSVEPAPVVTAAPLVRVAAAATTPSSSPSSGHHGEGGDDHGREHDSGDDHGGDD